MPYLIDGPHASMIAHDLAYVEPTIEMLCKLNGDDPDEYTCTECNYEFVFDTDEFDK